MDNLVGYNYFRKYFIFHLYKNLFLVYLIYYLLLI
jgi:hypothetical protein